MTKAGMDKLIVEYLQINGFNFSGITSIGSKTFKIKGHFVLEWDGCYPIVKINPNWISGLSAPGLIDLEYLKKVIQDSDDGTWYENYMNELSDLEYKNG